MIALVAVIPWPLSWVYSFSSFFGWLSPPNHKEYCPWSTLFLFNSLFFMGLPSIPLTLTFTNMARHPSISRVCHTQVTEAHDHLLDVPKTFFGGSSKGIDHLGYFVEVGLRGGQECKQGEQDAVERRQTGDLVCR